MRRLTPLLLFFYLMTFHMAPLPLWASDDPDHIVKVYYFHRRFRCPECVKTEYFVQKTLMKYFFAELKSGEVTWQIVDVGVKSNQHYLTDYDFMFNAVIVVEERDGKDVRYKNLERIFDLVKDEDAAVDFVRREVEEYLED